MLWKKTFHPSGHGIEWLTSRNGRWRVVQLYLDGAPMLAYLCEEGPHGFTACPYSPEDAINCMREATKREQAVLGNY